jgi:hypothetical protein
MNAVKWFLVFQVCVWAPYGLYLIIAPSFLAGAAGVIGETPTGTTELRAMYGGLQAAIGLLCAHALARPQYRRHALLALCFLSAGLGSSRFLGLLVDSSASGYTLGALGFELFNATIAILLFRKTEAESGELAHSN